MNYILGAPVSYVIPLPPAALWMIPALLLSLPVVSYGSRETGDVNEDHSGGHNTHTPYRLALRNLCSSGIEVDLCPQWKNPK